ncbi:MAG: VWA domain-containing protein [Parcubacteria group bacterium]|nr:VWA domain-containing protein [Parcubacteria group bacterium]
MPIDLIFHPPERFWFSFLLLFLVIPIVLEWRKRKNALSNPEIKLYLSTSRIPATRKRVFWWIAFAAATGFLVAAYANPEMVVTDWERVFEQVRVTVILDISRSMKKAEDVEPNRLEAAKDVVRNLVAALERDPELKGKYKLALIPFSGAALPYYLPFTVSRSEFLSHLESLDTETIAKRGTSLWAALRAYDELLLANPSRDAKTIDLGILISDGGKEEGKKERAILSQAASDLRDPYRAAHFLLSGERIIVRQKEPGRNTVLNTVGIGMAEPVPLKERDKAGNFTGYQHLIEGNPKSPVDTSTLDEQVLKELAKAGGGEYRHFIDRETIFKEFKALILAHRLEADKIPYPRYESARAWFLAPSFIIFYFLFGYGRWLNLVSFKSP